MPAPVQSMDMTTINCVRARVDHREPSSRSLARFREADAVIAYSVVFPSAMHHAHGRNCRNPTTSPSDDPVNRRFAVAGNPGRRLPA